VSRTGLNLDGDWRAAIATEQLRRSYQDPGFDDSSWAKIRVPGHWRRNGEFADDDGPLLYRTSFASDPLPAERRAWLVFDGIFYQSDVWLDGAYLGDTEGYFFPHQFEVTERTRARTEHGLSVEVTCASQRDRRKKRNLTGVFQHWDAVDATANPGGIWAGVRIEASGPVRIRTTRARCPEADHERARITLRAVLDSSDERSVTVRTRVAGSEHERAVNLAAGENQIEWEVIVPRPALWWPHALGDQPLHDLVVEVIGADGEVSDARRTRVGLRSIAMKNWVVSINGERLFLKGSNLGPPTYWLAEAGRDDYARDLGLARDAGLDLLRVHAHIGRVELYEIADEMGLLLAQDLPLQWAYHRSVRRQAARQAREAVDLLAHHPSLAWWCGHNSPMAIDPERDRRHSPTRRRVDYAIAQELPTYNRTVLDRSIASSLRRADGSRPVVPHSGMLPSPPRFDGTDSHLYLGWYVGYDDQLDDLAAAAPRLVRFVSEFGAQAVPRDASFIDATRWPDLDWDGLASRHGLQKEQFDRYVPPAAFGSFDDWALATRRYQADIVRFAIETLRRLKYRPTGGFAQFTFADSAPGVTFSLLDVDRRPKEAFDALVAACRPVIVVADRLPGHLHGDEALAIDVHAVSDLRTALVGAELRARVMTPDGEREHAWRGDVPADGCIRVTTLSLVVPPRDGELVIDLELRCGELVATNSYRTTIHTGDHEH
jgi:beta-mannosidase